MKNPFIIMLSIYSIFVTILLFIRNELYFKEVDKNKMLRKKINIRSKLKPYKIIT